MESGSVLKWVLLGVAIVLFFTVGMPQLTGGGSDKFQPLGPTDETAAVERSAEQFCRIEQPQFRAELSTRGGSLRHLWLLDQKYLMGRGEGQPVTWTQQLAQLFTRDAAVEKHPIDIVSTSREGRMPLRTNLHIPGSPTQQLPYDDLDWKLEAQDGKSCTFTYSDANTALTKTISTTGTPYELAIDLKVENRAPAALKHRLTVEQTAYRTHKETEGSLGRRAVFDTDVVTSTAEKTERLKPGDFEPGDFQDKEFTAEKWRRTPGAARWVATTNSYFAQIAIPTDGPVTPNAETQIEEYWDNTRYPRKVDDPMFGYVWRSRLAYPEVELAPQGSSTYRVVSYVGPMEREVLATVGYGTTDVIDLGWFPPIAKVLVWYLYKLYAFVGSWGWAIALLTLTVRTLLFPLSLAQIKSSMAMRRLKPEMDEINAKYKDDATQRGLAMQELWRKNKVANPVTGCIPVQLQMPVWIALYSALQTAVELFHMPFGPFIPDLSAPGKYLIIPLVLGGSSFIQQKLMPPQGDPAQQKMLLYMMPGIFTVMMLFLPAGLGVYMLTNTWLAIGQQVLVERYYRKMESSGSGIEVREKAQGAAQSSAPVLGKGKTRVRQ
jgi:YidC/Oxa1 family membrane protein insertase